MSNKVLIVAGGSGGHIFPAVATAEELQIHGNEIVFVASKRDIDKKLLANTGYKKYFLSVNPMPYKVSFSMVRFLLKVIYDAFVSAWILIKERPGVVVGFGGYVSGAVLIIAKMLFIKTVIHEQNIVMGRTNRMLCGFVDRVALSFATNMDKRGKDKTVVTGNPIRKQIIDQTGPFKIGEKTNLPNQVNVLVIGGSQGACSMNRMVVKDILDLDERTKQNLQVIHIAGDMDKKEVQKEYLTNNINAKVYNYVENIHNIYKIVDMAISRAGASAVFELAIYGIPMILIPYPNEKNSQVLNAKFFSEQQAAFMIKEQQKNSGQVKEAIQSLIENRQLRKSMVLRAKELVNKDAAKHLSDLIVDISKR